MRHIQGCDEIELVAIGRGGDRERETELWLVGGSNTGKGRPSALAAVWIDGARQGSGGARRLTGKGHDRTGDGAGRNDDAAKKKKEESGERKKNWMRRENPRLIYNLGSIELINPLINSLNQVLKFIQKFFYKCLITKFEF